MLAETFLLACIANTVILVSQLMRHLNGYRKTKRISEGRAHLVDCSPALMYFPNCCPWIICTGITETFVKMQIPGPGDSDILWVRHLNLQFCKWFLGIRMFENHYCQQHNSARYKTLIWKLNLDGMQILAWPAPSSRPLKSVVTKPFGYFQVQLSGAYSVEKKKNFCNHIPK